ADVIEAALPPELDPTRTDGDFGDFIFAPLGDYTAKAGLGHPERALDLLHALTRRFSMEFALRPFIDAVPEVTLPSLSRWARDPNYHVRRLVSEATRPRLPWAARLDLDLAVRLPLLTALHSDSTRYVTRSVANHLGDIAKEDANLVIDILNSWKRSGVADPEELAWLSAHALRAQIKAGHSGALSFLGYAGDAPVEAHLSLGAATVAIGDMLDITVEITARAECRVLVDYVLALRKANGSAVPKTYKMRALTLRAGQSTRIVKRHRFKGDATTFQLYPGETGIWLLVNGEKRAPATFTLTR
ncbi:MAG: hypothetical protein AAF761_11490, partial [Pseudomonadota bacterium]